MRNEEVRLFASIKQDIFVFSGIPVGCAVVQCASQLQLTSASRGNQNVRCMHVGRVAAPQQVGTAGVMRWALGPVLVVHGSGGGKFVFTAPQRARLPAHTTLEAVTRTIGYMH